MGFNLYLCCLTMCIFDTAQPALNAIGIKKRSAVTYCLLVLVCSLLEDIFIMDSFSVSIAGFILPLYLCCKVAINLSTGDAARSLAFAMVNSAGGWAIMQMFMQSTEMLTIDLCWVRGIATVAFTLMFTHNHSSAIITAFLAFFLSGYWVHMDLLIAGTPNYWAAGSGEELAVTAFILVSLLTVCQAFSFVGEKRQVAAMRAGKKAVS